MLPDASDISCLPGRTWDALYHLALRLANAPGTSVLILVGTAWLRPHSADVGGPVTGLEPINLGVEGRFLFPIRQLISPLTSFGDRVHSG